MEKTLEEILVEFTKEILEKVKKRMLRQSCMRVWRRMLKSL